MKWFNLSDDNYLTNNECLSLSCEMKYEELWKAVAVLRFQPIVIMNEMHEEFITAQAYIANLIQMLSFKDISVAEKWMKVYSP
jgi:hypothetical protein